MVEGRDCVSPSCLLMGPRASYGAWLIVGAKCSAGSVNKCTDGEPGLSAPLRRWGAAEGPSCQLGVLGTKATGWSCPQGTHPPGSWIKCRPRFPADPVQQLPAGFLG